MNDKELIAILQARLKTEAKISASVGAFNVQLWDKLAAKEKVIERQREYIHKKTLEVIELEKELNKMRGYKNKPMPYIWKD